MTATPRRRAVLGLILLLFFEGLLLYRYGWRHETLLHADLPSFYFASHMAFRHGQSPYDFPAMAAQAPRIEQPIYPYLHPPPALVPLAPLALVSYRAAKWAAAVGNHLLAPLLACLLAFRLGRFGDHALAFFTCAFVLMSFPVTQTIVHDQVNLAVTVLIVVAWLGLRRRDAWWAGLPLGAAVLLKQSPVVLLVVLALERRWRALWAALGAVGAAIAVSAVTVSREAWVQWWEVVRPSLAYGRVPAYLFSPACPYNQGLNGLVSRLFLEAKCAPTELVVPPVGRALTYAAALAVVGLSVAAVRASRRRPQEIRIDHGFALFLPAMFLIAPLAWEHHLVFVLPSVAVAAGIVIHRRRLFVPLACVLGACILGIALPLPIDHPFLRAGAWVHLVSLRTYAVGALWLVLLFLSFERGRGSAADGAEGERVPERAPELVPGAAS